MQIWDAASGGGVRTLSGHFGMVRCLAFSPDGELLAVSGGEEELADHGEIKVWEVHSGRLRFALRGHETAVYSLAFSPDGQRLASAGKGVRLWDTVSGQEIVTLTPEAGQINGVAFSPDGERVAGACFDRTIKVWEKQTGVVVRTFAATAARWRSWPLTATAPCCCR